MELMASELMQAWNIVAKIKIILILTFSLYILASSQLFAESKCQRIVSLAPSVTETIFEVGLGDKLVGVTTYCDYPPEAKKVAQLGNYFDTNIEQALALKTDLVIGLPESKQVLERFAAKNVKILQINNRSIEQILSSFSEICEYCDCLPVAEKVQEQLRLRLESIQNKTAKLTHKKAAVIISSQIEGFQNEFYLSGKDGFYTSVLKVFNLSNVLEDNTIALSAISTEGIVAMRPEVIFFVNSSSQDIGHYLQKLRKYLPTTQMIELAQDYAGKPGPRFILLLEDMLKQLVNDSGN